MHYIKNFFTVPSKEREAVMVLSGLFVLFFVLIPFIIRITSPDFVLEYEIIETGDESEDEKEKVLALDEFFDPNTISREGLIEIGLGGRLATTWIRFRERVSSFREKEDLLRLYGMDSLLYQQLEPWIEIQRTGRASAGREDRSSPSRQQFIRFEFDPNQLSADSLRLLGIPDRVANTIVNFRSRGGIFRQPEDMLRIFNMPEPLFYELEDWIKIEVDQRPPVQSELKKDTSEVSAPDKPEFTTIQPLDLNTTTAEQLRQFRGIGEVLSNRIVEYRDRLGGFYDVDQLTEVFGIEDDVLNNMKPKLLINKKLLSQININTATAQDLAQHPYINLETARRIVNYRTQNGHYAEVEHIMRIYTLREDWYDRTKWYLSAEQIVH